ncbi:MAG: VWA domain-containing protein [Pseudomonadota bacterium]
MLTSFLTVFWTLGVCAQTLTLPSDSAQDVREAATATEIEPNNRRSEATEVDVEWPIRGSLGIGDVDYFRFSIGDENVNRDIGFDLSTAVRVDLCLYGSAGKKIKCTRGHRTIFSGLTLKGDYLLSISTVARQKNAIAYSLKMTGSRPNRTNEEVEPNDRAEDASLLNSEGLIKGTISEDDVDALRFRVSGERKMWRIVASSEGINAISLETSGGRELQQRSGSKSERVLDFLFLPQGDYIVKLKGKKTAVDEPYTLTVEGVGALEERAAKMAADDHGSLSSAGARIETEPNDHRSQAQRMQFALDYIGELARGDTDYYRFYLPGHARVRFDATPAGDGQLSIAVDGNRIGSSRQPNESLQIEQDLLPGDHLLRLRSSRPGQGTYRLQAVIIDPFIEPDNELSSIEVKITGDTPTLAAYEETGQRLKLAMRVQNKADQVENLTVVSASSHAGVHVQSDQPALTLNPGEAKRVTFDIQVQPDLRDDLDTLISMGVRTRSNDYTGNSIFLDAACGVTPVNATRLWPIPEALLGQVNAAWTGMGGRLLDAGRHGGRATDDVVTRSAGAWHPKPGVYTVELGGDKPLTVIGTIIHPTGSPHTENQLKEFALELSTDGKHFTSVLEGSLRADAQEQGFVLEQPGKARFARLRMLNSYKGENREIAFGEWKVIVSDSPAEVLGTAVNIADNQLGGYDVYSLPFTGGRCCHETFSTAAEDGQFSGSHEKYEWVMGFRNNRAAKIASLQWVSSEQWGVKNTNRFFSDVDIAVAMDSPTGPWRPLAKWPLKRDSDNVATLQLDSPVWARFVKFRAAPPAGVPIVPKHVKIIEAATSLDYQSVVGEWGYATKAASFERYAAQDAYEAVTQRDAGDSRASASLLTVDNRVGGTVLVGEDEDWYRVSVSTGSNTLLWRLHNRSSIEYAYQLYDSAGREVVTESRTVDEYLELSSRVQPGEYYLKLYEPKRSVLFSWDTSGSVGPYYDVIDHTMKAFADGIRQEREEVNLIPFNDPEPVLLLDQWSSDPSGVSQAIVNSGRRFGSSNAESALLMATTELKDRVGTKAILFVTDAETDGLQRTGDLWRALSEVRPRVFSFELSSKGRATPQDMMQSYAAVNNGYYDYALTAGSLQVGFDRAICKIRRPKPYSISAHYDERALPDPGSLKVELERSLSQQDAVEVILDASGSMYKKLGDEFRYQISLDVLDDLVTNGLPDQIGFALRVFGNREASSCRTDLEIPLASLDRTAVREKIKRIRPQPYAYTPLAASIRRVATDLRLSKGRKTVVLITDGEESCDGDVSEAINALRENDIDVQLNIIGFDVDADNEKKAREAFQRWAKLGGGAYFDADSADGLADSLALATRISVAFDVEDANGDSVASGMTNGPTLSLLPGEYTITFADDSIASQAIEIISGEITRLVVE